MNFKLLKKRKVGMILVILESILSLGFIGMLFALNVLSTSMVSIMAVFLIAVDAFLILTQMTKKTHKAGKVIATILGIIFAMGSFYLFKTYSTLGKVSAQDYQIVSVSAIAMKKDSANTVKDALGYTFGIIGVNDRENTDNTIKSIESEYSTTLKTKEYSDATTLVDALYNGEVKAILFNEANRSMVLEAHDDFDDATKVLGSIENKKKLENDKAASDVTKEAFSVYISGIDTKGKVSATSRSDVNILGTVNPVTKQILLISTPRDYYVTLPNSNGVKDKLTHAGIYGVDCSMGTLETLYDTDVNYYVRVNFTGFEKIVDALGGVTVHSDYTFTSDWGPSFVKGDNKVNGKQALAFARQRHDYFRGKKTGLVGGDNQRGRDQQYLIKAIINKATSPSILANFSGLMDSVAESVETNMKSSEITDLVKMQLSDMSGWDIVMINATGTGSKSTTFSMPSTRSYVMVPDEASVSAAKKMVDKVIAGEKVTEDQFKELVKGTNSSTSSSTNNQ
ncbi:exopolysaccharide biosynthesis transcriptional activator EpsA [Lachnospiraceae bacterium KM106-2]|nr:exopolysaccharide biosynthesis transcriptional activator EpsA [Lachnospiraceae bacterium KM106-2]